MEPSPHNSQPNPRLRCICDICPQENPFADRICVVFSTKSGTMNFTEFLSMLSVFSASASRDIKSMWAFKIYGMKSVCVSQCVVVAVLQWQLDGCMSTMQYSARNAHSYIIYCLSPFRHVAILTFALLVCRRFDHTPTSLGPAHLDRQRFLLHFSCHW